MYVQLSKDRHCPLNLGPDSLGSRTCYRQPTPSKRLGYFFMRHFRLQGEDPRKPVHFQHVTPSIHRRSPFYFLRIPAPGWGADGLKAEGGGPSILLLVRKILFCK